MLAAAAANPIINCPQTETAFPVNTSDINLLSGNGLDRYRLPINQDNILPNGLPNNQFNLPFPSNLCSTTFSSLPQQQAAVAYAAAAAMANAFGIPNIPPHLMTNRTPTSSHL